MGSLSITVPTVSTSLYLSARTSGPFDNLDPYYYGVPSGYTLSINGTQGQTVYVAGLLYSPSESRCVPNQRIYLAIGNTTYAATTNDRGVAFWAVPLNVTSTLVSGYYGDYYALNVITEYYIPSTSGNVVVTIPGTVPQQTYLPTSQPQNDTVPPPVQSQEGGTETPETNGEAATSTFTYTLPTTAQVQQELAKYNIPIGAILITAGVGSIATGIIQERRKPNNS